MLPLSLRSSFVPICFSVMLVGRRTEGVHPGTAGFSLSPPMGGAFISCNMNTIEMSSNNLVVLTYSKFAFFNRYSSVSLSRGFVKMSATISLVAHQVTYSSDGALPMLHCEIVTLA